MVEPSEPMTNDEELPPEQYGTLTAEDDDSKTVDPSEVAGTANESDDEPSAH